MVDQFNEPLRISCTVVMHGKKPILLFFWCLQDFQVFNVFDLNGRRSVIAVIQELLHLGLRLNVS